MSKFLKYIFISVCCFAMVSCALEELSTPVTEQQKGPVEFIVRPTSFTGYSVTTKSTRALSDTQLSEVERKVATAYFLAFDKDGNRVMLETLNVTNNTIPSKNIRPDFGDSYVTVCFIANVPYSYVASLTHIDRLSDTPLPLTYATYSDTGFIGIPSLSLDINKTPGNTEDDVATACFPMFGISEKVSLSNPGNENKVVIELKRLFAKVQVVINLDLSDNAEVGVEDAYFEFNKFTVQNLPNKVRLTEGKTISEIEGEEVAIFNENTWVKDQDSFTESVAENAIPVRIDDDENATNGHRITFYTPEYVLLPDPAKVESFVGTDKDKQKAKPDMLFDDTIPVKVALNGNYHSVFGEDIDMTYSIYLGEDNFQSFSLIRNVSYTNNITIKGVAETDNRVEMKYSGFRVGFPYSVQMDAHFNVRPLRLQFTDEFIDGLEQELYSHGVVKIEILPAAEGAAQPTWLALERPMANQITGNTKYSAGYKIGEADAPYPTKRRYFTTGLINELNTQTSGGADDPAAGASVTFRTDAAELDPFSGQTITWVYIDEFTTQQANANREAILAVTFTMDGSSEGVTKKMLIRQSAVYPISFDNQTYGIELFEEYTMNYDSDEHYDDYEDQEGMGFVTDVNGIKWGLEGLVFSRNKPALQAPESVAINVSSNTHSSLKPLLQNGFSIPSWLGGGTYDVLDEIVTPIVQNQMENQLKNLEAYYDFYTSDDLESNALSGLLGTDGTRDYDGFAMNVEIIHSLLELHSSKSAAKLNGIVLDENPLSAIAYCYNKNKRDPDGNVVKLNSDGSLDITNFHWYAPAIKEIEGIIETSYNGGSWLHPQFETFASDLYWSCQPAYLNNKFEVEYDAKSIWTIIHRVRSGSIFTGGYTYTEKWRENLNAGYIAEGAGKYLEDDVKRARATQFSSEGQEIKSYSEHISKFLKIIGSFQTTPHTYSNNFDSTREKTKDAILGNLTSTDYVVQTGLYFANLTNYLNSVNWNDSSVIPEGDAELETPRRGPGNQTRDQVNRVRCVYYDHNYTTATRAKVSGMSSIYKDGYETTFK